MIIYAKEWMIFIYFFLNIAFPPNRKKKNKNKKNKTKKNPQLFDFSVFPWIF